ncbi:MAG: hypothetical protein D8M57_13250 [Candidatus Scalindua sp. AMX11]|nr:MAG: hypothetical protein DWQ00_11840 [Candidatus Scalindua sp.]NOG83758.1 hypothetical protein [Planctomycetota bacterium]RZV82917.1 MAG: hypothetical protein EX341_08995 [Candidatus Scalindua sp. SCAELEC01]TDE64461.1 MAG: hypothetical protein D8M57_13250 [Candidatus Scalindua sp. AMX11]GJQ59790.1 MAG: hypothetical protein SCALA701_25910 [Candidatus Scalindua sp.]
MGGKLTNEGEIDIISWYIKNVQTSRGANSLYLGLYTDTTEPAETITLATITELALTGYARIQLNDADWSGAADIATNLAKTFTAGEDWGNVYGYFICNVASGTAGEIIFVEHFSTGPFNVADTKTIEITPKITVA